VRHSHRNKLAKFADIPNWFLLTLCFALVFVSGSACGQVSDKKPLNPFFWHVQGKSNSVYILGVIYSMNKDFYRLDARIEKAFDSCKTLDVETDTAAFNANSFQQKAADLGTYPPGDFVTNHIGKEVSRLLSSYVALDSRYSVLYTVRPWLGVGYIRFWQMQELGNQETNSVEAYFLQKARAARKSIEELGRADNQLDLLASLSNPEQEEMLGAALLPDFKPRWVRAQMALTDGNVKGVETLISEDARRMPRLYAKLIVERNSRWLTEIEKHLTTGENTFAVLPLANLLGPDGLIKMLQKKGYSFGGERATKREALKGP
jgi:uncharacterized protein YbaP (TraB family)